VATAQLPISSQRQAKSPFEFTTAAHLLRVCRQRANNLGELLDALRIVSDDSIFQHTFRTLQEHHFIPQGFSNDFAHWAFAACNEVSLAERLASLDVREYTSLTSLRERIVKILEEYIQHNPRSKDRSALEPFFFCASETVVIPTSCSAHNLEEFIDGIEKVSLHSVHYHFIEARLRLKLTSNDFSVWLERELDLADLAEQLNRIDIYTSTLQEVRQQIARTLRSAQ
jgi:pyrroloquinoline quinone (PQQ) biosynthesis protein C